MILTNNQILDMKKPIYKKVTKDFREMIAFECCECGWIGTNEEKAKEYTDVEYGITQLVCPDCNQPDFYGIVGFENED